MSDDIPAINPAAGDPLSYPDVDQPSCQLLGPTALVVQGLMGLIVILSLVYKRHRETPKRPWRIWLFDVSKQVFGQLFVHGANLVVSDLSSHHASANACVSYFLNILIDTTFGVALIYVTLHALTGLFTERFQFKGFESGVYGNPPSVNYWFRQAALYVLSLSAMKAIVVTFLILFPGIYVAGEWLLSWTWTGEGDDLQVIFVMGLFPILMNVLQFWLIDSIVKASTVPAVALDVEHDAYQDREPLFQAGSDDEDAPHPSRPDVSNAGRSRHSISSLDSRGLNSHDDLSSATRIAAPDEDKSSEDSSKQVDAYAYPPSLTSSFTSSNASPSHDAKVPRIAKNLMKKTKRRDAHAPLELLSPRPNKSTSPRPSAGPSSIPQIPSPQLAPAPLAREDVGWSDSWEDSNDWDRTNHQKQDSLTTSGEWNSNHPSVPVDS